MAIAYDTETTSIKNNSNNWSFTHTATAAANLVVVIIHCGQADAEVSTLTYGGTACTYITKNISGTEACFMYYLAGDVDGANTVVVVMSKDTYSAVRVITFTGAAVDPLSASDNGYYTTSPANKTIAGVAAGVTVSGICTEATTCNPAISAGNTQLSAVSTTWNDCDAAYQLVVNTGNITMNWTWTTGTWDNANVVWASFISGALAKVVAGAMENTGTIVKKTSKSGMAGAQTNTGTATRLMLFSRTVMTGAITFGGTLVRATRKVLAGVFTPSGILDWLAPRKLIARFRDYFLRAEQVDHALTAETRDYILTAPKRD